MYKKLAVLVAALALIGLMVAPVMAQPYVHEFPQNFIDHITESYNGIPAHGTIFEEDGTPTVAIILGERALPHDVVGATLLGFKIGTHLYYWRAPDVDGSLLGDRYARKVWIEDWTVVLDRWDLALQDEVLDGTGWDTVIFAWNGTLGVGEFEDIYCVAPGINYWIAPQSVDSDLTLTYMAGYQVSTAEMNSVKGNGTIVFPVFHSLFGLWVPRDAGTPGWDDDDDGFTDEELFNGVDDDLDGLIDEDLYWVSYYATPGLDFDAKTGEDLSVAWGTQFDWTHVGFQFTYPETPQYLPLDVDIPIDWMGYQVMLESITDDGGAPPNFRVEFVIKDFAGNIIDRFATIDAATGAFLVDSDPTTFQRFWYGVSSPSLLKIQVDIDQDGNEEAVLSYFYVEIWDVDYDNDLVRCQFFSSYFVPPIIFEGYSLDDTDAMEYTPADLTFAPPANRFNEPSWATYPPVIYQHLGWGPGVGIDQWVYVEGIDTPPDDLFSGDYVNAEDETVGGDWIGVIMDAKALPSGKSGPAFVGEFIIATDLNDDFDWADPFEDTGRYTAFFLNDKLWNGGNFIGLTFYGPGAGFLPNPDIDASEEFVWTDVNLTWAVDTTKLIADHYDPSDNETVWWTSVACDEGPLYRGVRTFLSFYIRSTDYFEKTDCELVAEGTPLIGYEWWTLPGDGFSEIIDLIPESYYWVTADDDIAEWWYNSTLHVYNVTGFHAGIYDSFNCLPGTAFNGTAHVDPVTGAITWGPGGADQYYEGEDVFSFIKTPLAYIDSQVFDGTILSADVIDKDLILVGGPHVNSVVDYLNDSGYLYLYYVVDKLFYPADIDPTTGEPNYYDLAYALGLTGMPWPEENIPKYTTGLGAIQFTAKWNGATGPAAAWDVSDSDPWGTDPGEPGDVENWILVVAGTDRFGTYAASVALADPTKIIYETAPNFCNTSFVIVIGVTPYAVAPAVVPGVAPVVMVLVGTTPGVTPIGVGVGAGP